MNEKNIVINNGYDDGCYFIEYSFASQIKNKYL